MPFMGPRPVPGMCPGLGDKGENDTDVALPFRGPGLLPGSFRELTRRCCVPASFLGALGPDHRGLDCVCSAGDWASHCLLRHHVGSKSGAGLGRLGGWEGSRHSQGLRGVQAKPHGDTSQTLTCSRSSWGSCQMQVLTRGLGGARPWWAPFRVSLARPWHWSGCACAAACDVD